MNFARLDSNVVWPLLLLGVVIVGLVCAHRLGQRYGDRGFLWGWLLVASLPATLWAVEIAILVSPREGMRALFSTSILDYLAAAALATLAIRRGQRARPSARWPSLGTVLLGAGAFIIGIMLTMMISSIPYLLRR